MADWNTPASETDDELPPIPDGGLRTSMPAWLKTAPAWAAHTIPAPDHSPIDPATLVREEDVPKWMRDLSRHMRERAAAASRLPDLADTEIEAADAVEPAASVVLAEDPSADDSTPDDVTTLDDSPPDDDTALVEPAPANDALPGDHAIDSLADDAATSGDAPEPAALPEDVTTASDRQGVLVDTAWDPRAILVESTSEPAKAPAGPSVDYRPVVIPDQTPHIIEETTGPEGASHINVTPRPTHNWRDPIVVVLLILAAIVIVGTIYLLS
jgi:hypothetical protein